MKLIDTITGKVEYKSANICATHDKNYSGCTRQKPGASLHLYSYKDFRDYIFEYIKQPKFKLQRKGQAVFNAVDELFGVARAVQFDDRVDCFYNDNHIIKFLVFAYDRAIKSN